MNMTLLPYVELLGKSAAVLLAAWIFTCLPRLSAAQRSLIWLGAFLVLLLLPLTLLAPPLWEVSVAPRVSTVVPIGELGNAALGNSLSPKASSSLGNFVRDHWQNALAFVWAGGVVILLGRKVLGLFFLRKLLHQSWVVADLRVAEITAEARAAIGVRQHVTLRAAAACLTPLTWGIGRTVILLPRDVSTWPESRLQAALRHEFAHIARYDWCSRWLANVAAIFFWLNPLTWIGLRSLVACQEQACDDRVIATGIPGDDYAEDLLACARTLVSAGRHDAALSMARQSTLKRRIASLLDEKRNASRTGPVARVVLFLSVATLLVLSAAAQVVTSPGPAPDGDAITRSKGLTIPEVSFDNASLDKVAAVLQQESVKADPAGKGLEVHYVTREKGRAISLSAKKRTLFDIVVTVKNLAGLKEVAFTQNAVVLIDSSVPEPEKSAKPEPQPEVVKVASQLENIVLPKVELRDMPLDAVATYLEAAAKKADPKKIGVRIVCQFGWEKRAPRVSLGLNDIPVGQAIRYVAQLSGSDLTIGPDGVEFEPGKPSTRATPAAAAP